MRFVAFQNLHRTSPFISVGSQIRLFCLTPIRLTTTREEVLCGAVGAFEKRVRINTELLENNPVKHAVKVRSSLKSQRHFLKGDTRERRYALCIKCGKTNLTVGFNNTPSARLGIHSACANELDFTHHRWRPISEHDYDSTRAMPLKDRINWFLFDK
eukprot:Tbor_TRINITY_DN623_c0_g1::TRINITY_DN623_c0_g1_i1::g.1608::m.1608